MFAEYIISLCKYQISNLIPNICLFHENFRYFPTILNVIKSRVQRSQVVSVHKAVLDAEVHDCKIPIMLLMSAGYVSRFMTTKALDVVDVKILFKFRHSSVR